MNIFSPHISFAELAELAEQCSTASPEQREHLSTCSQCSKQLESIRQAIDLMRSDTTEDAPAALLNYTKNVFRGRERDAEPAAVRRVQASVSFDSLTNAPAFGLRSQAAVGRQLIYAAEIADIEVRISPADAEWHVAGQVLGTDCISGEVELESEGFSVSATLNDLCEFSFGTVPAGAYKLSVRLPNLIVETPRLELGP
jgi:hypothetical protein